MIHQGKNKGVGHAVTEYQKWVTADTVATTLEELYEGMVKARSARQALQKQEADLRYGVIQRCVDEGIWEVLSINEQRLKRYMEGGHIRSFKDREVQ